jgi:hypothetical protein
MSNLNERFALSRFSAAVPEAWAGGMTRDAINEVNLLNNENLWPLLPKVSALQA